MRKTLLQLIIFGTFSLGLIFDAAAQKIRLSWETQSADSIKEFFVYKKIQGQTKFELIGQVTAPDSVFWDNQLIVNTNVYYAVTSVDFKEIEGPFSRLAALFVPDRFAPFGDFEVEVRRDAINLSWRIWKENQSWDFEIYRSKGDKEHFQQIAKVTYLSGMVSNRLQFLDRKLAKGHYFYKILTNGKNGGVFISATKRAKTTEPAVFSLEQNYPNPFNTLTKIRFGLGQRTRVKIKIFDLQGRKVINLMNSIKSAGAHEIKWNGRNSSNEPVASGTYFVVMRVGNSKKVKRILLLK